MLRSGGARHEPLAVEHPERPAWLSASPSPLSPSPGNVLVGGLIYIDCDDPAIMVGNRFGVGWTPNLGNPKARLNYGGIPAIIAVLVVVRVAAGT
jgi:hypothetical protein